jgi:SAM-dependent methyltransferase
VTSEDFSRFEFEGWQRVAERYEEAWSRLTRLFVPGLLEALDIQPGLRLLDVACGPGYVAEAALAFGASPIGVDFSPAMIRLAQARNPQIEFRMGDAQALDFPDNKFDIVAMNFGILHLSNPEAAFAEARRVLRVGGRFGFSVWSDPAVSPGARIVEEALKAHANMDVELPAGPSYFGYGDPEECRRILGRSGFDPASLGFRTLVDEWQVPSASFVFEAERDAGVRTAAVLAAQTRESLRAIQNQIEKGVMAYATAGGFSIPYAANVITVTAASSVT